MSSADSRPAWDDLVLPGLAEACDPDRMLPRIRLALADGGGGRAVIGCQVRYLKWKPGTSAHLAYEVDREAGARPSTPTWLYGKLLAAAPAGRSQSDPAAGSRRRPDRFLEDLPMALWIFPHDPAIRGLAASVDRERAARTARRCFRDLVERGFRPAVRRMRLEIVRYKPVSRCVVRQTFSFQHPAKGRVHRTLYCRAYAEAGRAVQVRRAIELLEVHAPEMASDVILPAPAACDAGRGLLYERAVAARELLPLLGRDEAGAVLRSLGRGLARLHALEADLPLCRDLASELWRLDEAAAGLASYGSPLGEAAAAVLRDLERASLGLGTWPMRVTHGDLHCGQVLARGRRAVLVDFDEVGIGDPLGDLACWEAHLIALACRGRLGAETASAAAREVRRAWAARAALRRNGESDLSLDPRRYRWHLAAQLLRLAEAPLRGLEPGARRASQEILSAAGRSVRPLGRPAARGARAPAAPAGTRGRDALRARLREGLDPAVHGPEIARLVRQAHAGALDSVRVKGVWPLTPGRWYIVYEVRLRRRSGPPFRTWAYLGLRTGDAGPAPALSGPWRRFASGADPLALLDADPILRRPPSPLQGRAVSRELRAAALPDPFGPPVASSRMEWRVLSYRPEMRCAIRYTVRDGAATRSLIGKVFSSGARARAALAVLEAIRRAFESDGLNGGDLPVSAALPRLRLILFPELQGRTLHDLLMSDHAGAKERDRAEDFSARAARCAAAFHGQAPPLDRTFDLEAELDVLRTRIESTAILHPAHAVAAARALREVEVRVDETLRADPVQRLIHRDLYDKQILFAGGRVVLLDLDTACLGDPALDVGNFLAHLTLRSLQRHRRPGVLAPFGRVFREAYGAAAGPFARTPAFDRRVAFYESTSLLRLALLYLMRPRQSHLFPPLIRETRRSLQDIPGR